MALGAKSDSAVVALTTTAATTVQAAPGTGLSRFIKHIKVVNAGAQATYNLGLKASTTAPAATDAGIIALAAVIPANSSIDHVWNGDGLLVSNAAALNLNGSASAATVSVHIMGVIVAS